MTAAEVRERLNTIVDPCSVVAGAPAGLVDMGLVRDVRVEGDSVRVRIGLTEPGCMMGASFVCRARELLDDFVHVDVELEHDCGWTPRDLDNTYAARLEAVLAARLGAR